MAVILVAATVAGTSAFAESRHSEGTRSRAEGARSGSVSAHGQAGRGNESRNGGEARPARTEARRSEARGTQNRDVVTGAYERRVEGRNQGTFDRRADASNDTRARNQERRSESRGSNGTYRNGGDRGSNRGSNGDYRNGGDRGSNRGSNGDYRNGNRNGSRGGTYDRGSRGNNNRGSWGNNNRGGGYYHQGRVSNYQRYGGGYRVWIVGAPYPFYVPLSYWRADRFRIGLSIGLGGYYNPGGYYDYYDGYRGGYDNNLNSEADFRGVVESVDWRRDTFVVRNEETGNFITVVMRDRRDDPVRPGDYISVRGDWTTRGYFRAYDVDILD